VDAKGDFAVQKRSAIAVLVRSAARTCWLGWIAAKVPVLAIGVCAAEAHRLQRVVKRATSPFVFSRVIYKSALHFTMHDASREVHDRRDTDAAAGVNCWVCGNHTVTVFPFTPRSSQAICSSAIAML
jgi:hypothetical protein